MDILGIGFPELVFIFIIALMVFGPRRLPEIAGKAGRTIRDLRNMSQGFLAEWQREITAAARLEEIEQVRKELEETKQVLRQSQTEVASGAAQFGQTVNSIASPKPANSNNSVTTKSKPAESTPDADPSTTTPETTPAPEVAEEGSTKIPHSEKSAAPESPVAAGDSSSGPVEMPAETSEAEKKGADSETAPAPVAPEVAE
jgi:Tat protein translocase TatB subunit